MPNRKKSQWIQVISILFCFSLFTTGALLAQPDPTTGPTCWPPPCIPIDGGISFLVAAGVAFGVKKTLDTRSKKNDR